MPKKILLVDDEPLMLKGLKYSLEQEGYETLTAMDGEEALNVFSANQVDLVLLDVMLPKMDGIQVCQRIREQSNVPIIMLTAKGEDMDKILGLEYGADDYMTKPFNVLEVKARIKSIFRRASQQPHTEEKKVVRVHDMEVNLVNVMARETVLRRLLDEVKAGYDYVLLDCRPSLGMLVINALSAADQVLIPVQADYLAAEGMTELIGTVQSIKRQINPKLNVGGVFLTMANETNFRRDIVQSVKETYGKHLPVLNTVIPATVRLAEVSTADKSIFKHDPKGKAAEAYTKLTKEVMACGERQRKRASDLAR